MSTTAVGGAGSVGTGGPTKADIALIDKTQPTKPFGKLMGVPLVTAPLTKDAQDLASYLQDKTGNDWVQIQVLQADGKEAIKGLDQLLSKETIKSLDNLQPGYTDQNGNPLPFGKGLNKPYPPTDKNFDPKNPLVENPATLDHDPRTPKQLAAIAALDNLIWGGPDGSQSAEDADKNRPEETTVALKTGGAFKKDIVQNLVEPPPDPSTVGSDPHAQNAATNSSATNAAQGAKTGAVTQADGTPNERGLINQKLAAAGLKPSQVNQQKKKLTDPEKAQFEAQVGKLIEAFKKDHPNAEVISAAYDNNDDTHDDRWYFLDRARGTIFVLDFGSNG
jgi:hypothetical protein